VKSPRSNSQQNVAKLEALNLTALSEEERLSAVAEIRAQLAESVAKRGTDPTALVRKLALLKIWQKLVQMRVTDLQKDRAPPEVKPAVERMFAVEVEEKAEEAPVEAAVEPPPPPPEPVITKKRKAGSTVAVKLTEEAVIKGKTVASEEVVKVSRKEADGLVEAGKGTVVDE
jgi:hypothetical protein